MSWLVHAGGRLRPTYNPAEAPPLAHDGEGYIPLNLGNLSGTLLIYQSTPTAQSLHELGVKIGECLEELPNKFQPRFTANQAHFDKFRVWRAQKRHIVHAAATDPQVIKLKQQLGPGE